MRKFRIILALFFSFQIIVTLSFAEGPEDFISAGNAFKSNDCDAANKFYNQAISSGVLSIEELSASYLNLSKCAAKNNRDTSNEYLWRYAQIKNDKNSLISIAKYKLSLSRSQAVSRIGEWNTLAELKSQQAEAEGLILAENAYYALSAMINEEYDKAITLYTETLKKGKFSDFAYALAHFDRSIAYEKEGLIKEAVSDMDEFTWILPNDTHGVKRLKELKAMLP